jgi:hypothetical protein
VGHRGREVQLGLHLFALGRDRLLVRGRGRRGRSLVRRAEDVGRGVECWLGLEDVAADEPEIPAFDQQLRESGSVFIFISSFGVLREKRDGDGNAHLEHGQTHVEHMLARRADLAHFLVMLQRRLVISHRAIKLSQIAVGHLPVPEYHFLNQ